FVETAGAQRICPRQVDQPDGQAGRGYRQALLALDRDTGVVRNLLPAAGQRIEQRRLAAVGIADEGDSRRRCDLAHSLSGSTRMEPASRRRSATVASLTRTAIGSRPNNPWCRISTRAPSTNPSSISRRSSSAAESPWSPPSTRTARILPAIPTAAAP